MDNDSPFINDKRSDINQQLRQFHREKSDRPVVIGILLQSVIPRVPNIQNIFSRNVTVICAEKNRYQTISSQNSYGVVPGHLRGGPGTRNKIIRSLQSNNSAS